MKKFVGILAIALALAAGAIAALAPAPAEALDPPCGTSTNHTWWDYPGACMYQYSDCSIQTVCEP